MSLEWPQARQRGKKIIEFYFNEKPRDFRAAQEMRMSDHTEAMTRPAGPSVADAMKAKLEAAFAPISLEVIDESHKHAGHAHVAAQPGRAGAAGETHFKVKVVSQSFEGKSRVERHRAINAALAQELGAGVHALAIDAKAPGE